MGATVDRAALADALAWIVGGIPTRVNVPVLAGVLLTADGDTLTGESFGYEECRRVTVPATDVTPGRVCVPAAAVAPIVGKWAAVGNTVTIVDGGERVTFACGTAPQAGAVAPGRRDAVPTGDRRPDGHAARGRVRGGGRAGRGYRVH